MTLSTAKPRFAIMLFYILFFNLIAVCPAFSVQGVNESNEFLTVIVDPKLLSDEQKSHVIRALERAKMPSASRVIKVKEGQTLSHIVDDRYRYDARNYPKTTNKLIEVLAEVNNVPDPNRIRVGQKISLPDFPVRPLTQARSDSLQYLSGLTNSMSVTRLAKIEKIGRIHQFVDDKPENAATWALRLSAEQLKMFNDSVGSDVLSNRGVYEGAPNQLYTLNVPKITSALPDTQKLPTQQTIDFAGIKSSDAPKMYLLDFFAGTANNPCPHGAKVYDVVSQALEVYGGKHLINNVIRKDLDFFANSKELKRFVDKYIDSISDGSTRLALRKSIEAIIDSPSGKEAYAVPSLYLQALFADIMQDPSPAIISSSFWTRTDAFRLLPSSYSRDSNINIFSAVSDNEKFVEKIEREEPVKTFRDLRRDYPVSLVVGADGVGSLIGMQSMNGDGIAAMGQSSGWGSENSCIKPADMGTSFSTPSVAATAFLARAFWKHAGKNVSANDLKVRLMLATNLKPQYVGLVASAGEPLLQRLLPLSGGYAVKRDGTVLEIENMQGSVSLAGGTVLPVKRDERAFSGIQFVDGNAYGFVQSEMKWSKLEGVAGHISFRFAGGAFDDELSVFVNQYSALVALQ